MYVIRELEDAIDDCKANDSNRNADGVNSVDEAAAFYTGSLERTDGNGVGVLVYDLSDKFCVDFKTCGVFGDDVKGTSKVNLEIFKQFNIIKAAVIDKLCDSAIKSKNEIVKQLFVPLIQGTLRTAQILSTQGADYEDRAEGAAAALAVLPMLHDCDSDAATIIFNNMKPSALVTDHAAVKKAIESTYGCLKISCPDVGGFYDFSGAKYFSGSEPCDSVKDSGVNVWLAVGISVGVLPILVISVVVIALMFVKRQKTSDPAPSVSPAAVPDRTTVAAEATSKE